MRVEIGQTLREFNHLYKDIDALYHETALRLGLSDSAFAVLYIICLIGDGCQQRDICGLACLSKQTIHSSVRKLERDGLLTLSPGRGRDMHLWLTDVGRQVAKERVAPVIQIENSVFQELAPEEREELLRLMGRYRDSLREKLGQLMLPGSEGRRP